MRMRTLTRFALVSLLGGLLLGCGASNPAKEEVGTPAKESTPAKASAPAKPSTAKATAAKASAPAGAVRVQSLTPYRDGVSIPIAVRSECGIQAQLPEFIESYARERGIAVVRGQDASTKAGRALQLDIVNLVGLGGGAWSGAKSVTVEGKLFENGKVVGSFTATRYSGGGFMGGYKGTCSILGRCVKALGQDIANWLQAPTMDARLGDGA